MIWRVGRRTIGEPCGDRRGLRVLDLASVRASTSSRTSGASTRAGRSTRDSCSFSRYGWSSGRRRPASGLFGLVVGLAIWQSVQLVPIVLPAIAWAIVEAARVAASSLGRRRCCGPRGASRRSCGTLRHGGGSFTSPIEDTTTYAHRLRIFASPLMPMMLGLRTPFTQEVAAAGRRRPARATVASSRCSSTAPTGLGGSEASLLYVVAAAFPFLYAIAPATLFSQEPKYLVVLSPVLVLLVAQLASSYWRAVAVARGHARALDRDAAQDGDLLRRPCRRSRLPPRATSAR